MSDAREDPSSEKAVPDLTCPDPAAPEYWYGTKAHIAKWVDEVISTRLLGKLRYYHWIAPSFDQHNNPPSSNPLAIYQRLHRASSIGEQAADEALEAVRRHLLQAVYLRLRDIDEALEAALKKTIARAGASLFRPEVWRVRAEAL